ncbi:GSCOCG00012090001-RA-CDS [Cotesia congregata]|nr:GSCOCG00012090001-RA-CDS [Cotesia congregata]
MRTSLGTGSGNNWFGQGIVAQSWSKAEFFCLGHSMTNQSRPNAGFSCLGHSMANQCWPRLGQSLGRLRLDCPVLAQARCAKLGCLGLGQARPRHLTLAVPTWGDA